MVSNKGNTKLKTAFATSALQKELELREVAKALRDLRLNDAKSNDDDLAVLDVVERALARFTVIRSVGYIESTRDLMASQYIEANSHPRVLRRAQAHLNTGLGVTPKQLCDFVGTFDPSWREELHDFLEEDDSARSNLLGAMVAVRKKIAHGDGDNVTSGRALQWSEAAIEIGGFLQRLFR